MKQLYLSIFKEKPKLSEDKLDDHFPFITSGVLATPNALISHNKNFNKKNKKKKTIEEESLPLPVHPREVSANDFTHQD